MEKLAERDHVGDRGQGDQRDADDAEPRLLSGDASWIGNEENDDQPSFEAGNDPPVPEAPDETVGQDELEGDGGQDGQKGRPSRLALAGHAPGDGVVSTAPRRLVHAVNRIEGPETGGGYDGADGSRPRDCERSAPPLPRQCDASRSRWAL